MKIAAFNVENLFERPKAFNESNNTISRKVIDAVAELNNLFEKSRYLDEDKTRMLQLVEELELNRFNAGPFALIRKIRGSIFKRPRSGGIEVVARGREDWIGWAELKKSPVNEVAVLNTGRVIRDVDASILVVIEAENRVALKKFSEFVSRQVNHEIDRSVHPYTEIMLIDGNDDRGIDVGLMTKSGYSIGIMRSHIHDFPNDIATDELREDRLPEELSKSTPVFSRDCPEYAVTTPDGETIWVLPNHFKSKFGGNSSESIAKRKAQALFTRAIYERLRASGQNNVIVLGDLNDTPDSEPLQPLLAGSDLKDVSEHRTFDTGEFGGIGTFGLGNDSQKIDYLLLSPALFNRVSASGVFRKGAWPGVRPRRWETYPELTHKTHVASDHHVIWAEIE